MTASAATALATTMDKLSMFQCFFLYVDQKDSANTLSMQMMLNQTMLMRTLAEKLTSVHLMKVIVIQSLSVHYTESTTQRLLKY